MSEPNLHDLAARLARGEEAAFAELYDACADRLHQYLTVRIGSQDAASDVLQAAFLRAVISRRKFRGVENPVAYLFQIARNEAVRAASKQRRPKVQQPQMADDSFISIDSIAAADDAEAVAAALTRLTADDREIVELKIYAGLTFREISDVTSRPQGTVATQYRRALESLRGWFTKQIR
jgi:RNA polymerase sigma-70 factor, ECF subfamily